MDITYCITPFLAWFIGGSLKFTVNSIQHRRLVFKNIDHCGFPSNHSCIVSSMAALIALREGINNPYFGLAVTIAFIVIMDACSLRRQIGKQASLINLLAANKSGISPLRERVGHNLLEILAGIATGCLTALLVNFISLKYIALS